MNNTIGGFNSAFGPYALKNNISGNNNIAVGYSALYTQSYNPGYSYSANNIAIGYNSLLFNQPTSTTNGVNNTATGSYSLTNNTTGTNNTAFGYNALQTNTIGSHNTAVGYNANVSSNNLGDATAIGSNAVTDASDKVVIGGPYPNYMVIGGYVGWSTFSDGRFKEDVRQDVPGLAFIEKLNPVTYSVDNESLIDHITQLMPDSIAQGYHRRDLAEGSLYHPRQTGFIAQEVEASAQETGYDFDGVNPPKNPTDHYSLSYASFVVPLVKAVQEQQDQIEQLKAENAALQARLSAIESKLAE